MANLTDQPAILFAVGDIIVNRERPEEMFEPTASFLKTADLRFFQCEAPMTDKGSVQLHGTGTRVDPRNLAGLTYAGFNIASMSGNHALDWGAEGMFDAQQRLQTAGMTTFGVGRDIQEARKPAIITVKGRRVAFLGYCSVHPVGYEADDGKPGLAPLRALTLYEPWDFQPGTPPRIRTFVNDRDVEAMREDIRAARAEADVVVLSIHWGVHFVPVVIADYQRAAAHAAIDAGADLILGHHAHLLKGIEVYKGKVIFYSLGNWAIDVPMNAWPTRPGFKRKFNEQVAFYKRRSNPEYPLYPLEMPHCRETILVKAAIGSGGVQRVSFFPAVQNKRNQPILMDPGKPEGRQVTDYLAEVSQQAELPVRFVVDGAEVLIDTTHL